MHTELVGQVLDEILPALEALETQNVAVLQFLKAEGLATDQQLQPYLQSAADASNVRWLATRIRIMSLLSSAERDAQRAPADAQQLQGSDTTSELQARSPEPDHNQPEQQTPKRDNAESAKMDETSSEEIDADVAGIAPKEKNAA